MKSMCIGIDIGGTNSVYAAVDQEGNVHGQGELPTPGSPSIEAYCDALAAGIASLQVEALAVGVGAPNGNYHKGTVEQAPNLPWKGVLPLADLLSERLSLPVYLTNDANAAAIGEGVFGAAKGLKDYLVVTLGTGLGSGYVVNGQLIYGSTGLAGELGHVIVEPGGRLCGCGRKGCLETYVSVTALVRSLREKLEASDVSSALRNVAAEELDGKAIFAAAKAGDELALQCFEELSACLGLALANTVAITSPSAIFLCGGLALAGDLLLQPTRRHFQANIFAAYAGISIQPSALPDSSAGFLGAAALAFQEHA